jgi:hypothetical protein
MHESNSEDLLARRLQWADAQSLAGEAIEFFPLEGGDPMALTVVDASERDSSPRMIQFALRFRGPAQPRYSQGTYRFRHTRLGDYAFFITPVAANEKGVYYEACFSHVP